MGNVAERISQRENQRLLRKRDMMHEFVHGVKRGHIASGYDGDNQSGSMPSRAADNSLPGLQQLMTHEEVNDLEGGGPHQLTDREREAWLYRMENEAIDVINDNMELQDARQRERERREERRAELENLGADGLGTYDAGDLGRDDPTMNREQLYQRDNEEDQADDQQEDDQRSPPSSRRSSPRISFNGDDDDREEDVPSGDNDFGSDGDGFSSAFSADEDIAGADDFSGEDEIGDDVEASGGEDFSAAEDFGGGNDFTGGDDAPDGGESNDF